MWYVQLERTIQTAVHEQCDCWFCMCVFFNCMYFLYTETSAEPSLQAKQLLLKRARLADDLNDKISQRPGPIELIHKNILPVHSTLKQAFIGTKFKQDTWYYTHHSKDVCTVCCLIGEVVPTCVSTVSSIVITIILTTMYIFCEIILKCL